MQPVNDPLLKSELAIHLQKAKTIAIVGLSPKTERPSNMVGGYLINAGYTIYPVNPGQTEILEQPCYADLKSLPGPVDIVDIFRKSEDVLQITEQVIRMDPLPKVIWMQLGVVNEDAAQLARDHGIFVVMDRCIKIEHQTLL